MFKTGNFNPGEGFNLAICLSNASQVRSPTIPSIAKLLSA